MPGRNPEQQESAILGLEGPDTEDVQSIEEQATFKEYLYFQILFF